ncbi:phaC PHA synthase [Vibrio sp. UCD-FRSSP16_10]|uniref:VC2662 family protein n=1 Tax=unclassified Vibrio TaxID=2614977 RepID=UPI0008008B68|nr:MULTISPECIES: phaC PHA synthase [unclassified Vibrio]OBT17028.1 phaC PHA synthase [Vibrio sp. UCD-FRSSP16_30]OBT22019.1 phaC PHA synthase [Vibrio sp. UCD-FRSSP16_10]
MKKRLVAVALASSIASSFACAQEAPVMFSTIDMNAPHVNSVKGVRLSVLHGKVSEVKGVDVSLVGMSETDRTTGLNFNLMFGANKVNQEMKGLSWGWFNWNTGQTTGVNLGAANITHNVKGVNLSIANISDGNTMADIGVVSLSKQSKVQVGIFNHTRKIEGVQVGLINCADNGFLKCFPIINFAK